MTLILSPLFLLLASVWLVPESAAALQTLPGRASNGPATSLASKPGVVAARASQQRELLLAEKPSQKNSVHVQTSVLGPSLTGDHLNRHRHVKKALESRYSRVASNRTRPDSTASTTECSTAFDQLTAIFSDPADEADLTHRALFLGIGAGTSLASALNLTGSEQLDASSRAAVAEYGGQSTANDLIAESVGKGIVTILAPALGSSNITTLASALERYSASISEGFGRGLVGAAVNFAMQFIGNGSVNTNMGLAGASENSSRRIKLRAEDSSPVLNLTAEAAVSVVAQALVNRLSCRGVGGLAEAVKNVVGNNSVVIPDMSIDVAYKGNQFSLNLRNGTFVSNGLSSSTLAILTAAHAGFMLLAFFVVQPIIIILESLLTFHRLVGINPMSTAKTNWYINTLHLGLLPVLALAGLIFALVASGSSEHFQTEHGIMGLIAVAFVPVSSALGFSKRWRYLRDGVPVPAPFATREWLALSDALGHQVLLFLGSFLQGNGLDDLDSISLCLFSIEPDTLVSVVNSFAFLWNAAQTGITLEWWLGQRKGEWKKYLFFWRKSHTETQDDDVIQLVDEKRRKM